METAPLKENESVVEQTWARVRTDEELRSFVDLRFATLPDTLEVE